MSLPGCAAALVAVFVAGCATAPVTRPSILRLANPSADSPTSAAVEVPASATLVYVSGQTATRRSTGPGTDDSRGSTYEQTLSALDRVEAVLGRAGLGLGHVVKATVYLVAPVDGHGQADTAGFARAWSERIGTAPGSERPARSTVQVAALGAPGVWVEIEVIAARVP